MVGNPLRGLRELDEEEPSRADDPTQYIAAFEGTRSLLEPSIALAKSFPGPEEALRITLLTDGHLEDAIPPDIGVEVIQSGWRRDVVVEHLEVPRWLRGGESFEPVVKVRSSFSGDGIAVLTLDHTELARLPFHIPTPGEYSLVFPSRRLDSSIPKGMHVLRAYVQFPGEQRLSNNFGVACMFTSGLPRILVLESAAGDAGPVPSLLKAQDFDVVQESEGRLEVFDDMLHDFDLVVVAASRPESLTLDRVNLLRGYIEHGGSLLWLAKPSGEGKGLPPEFEEMLPVVLDPSAPPAPGPKSEGEKPSPPAPTPQRANVLAPPIALALAIDKSGSMAATGGPGGQGGLSSLQLAKEACLQAIAALSERDVVSVMAFDVVPRWIVEFTPARDISLIEAQVRRLMAGGGTAIYPAVVEVANALIRRPEPIRHVILLSDGVERAPVGASYENLLRLMASSKISVTTVCVGVGEYNADLMFVIASKTGGRFIYSDSYANVPKVFVEEARRLVRETLPNEPASADPTTSDASSTDSPPPPVPTEDEPRPAVVEKTQVVKFGDLSETTKGMLGRSLPSLYGYVPAKARPAAEIPLTVEERPLLALGRRGLGRTAAWMSDWGSDAMRDWTSSELSQKIVGQIARHLGGKSQREVEPRVAVQFHGPKVRLRVEGIDPKGLEVALVAPEGKGLRVCPLSSHSFETEFLLERDNEVYRVQASKGEGDEGLVALGLVRAFPDEFRTLGPAQIRSRDPREPEPAPRTMEVGWWFLALAALTMVVEMVIRRFGA
jgi:hypothetical protein